MIPLFAQFLTRRMEVSDRGILLSLRWLFFLVLSFLFFYSTNDPTPTTSYLARASLLVGYAFSNLAFTWATRKGLSVQRWSMPIFLIDLVLIGLALYSSIGPDMDLYLMCFLIIYLSTLGRQVRDA